MNTKLFNKTCQHIINSAIDTDGIIGNSSQIGTLGEKTVHAVVNIALSDNSAIKDLYLFFICFLLYSFFRQKTHIDFLYRFSLGFLLI